MNRAVVVGSFNFIGYSLTMNLLNKGIEVHGLTYHKQENQHEIDQMLEFLGRNANFKFDLGSEIDIEKCLASSRFNTLFYCLNDPTTFHYEEDVEQHLQFSKELMEKALSCCQKKMSHIIYISSLNMFDMQHQVIDEHSLPNPNSNHAMIHYEEEKCMVNAAVLNNVPYTIIRVPTVYGPWQPAHMAYQQLIMNKLHKSNSDINIVENTCDLLYIDDVVEALAKAGMKRIKNEIIHLASGKENQWLKGANILLDDNSTLIDRKNNTAIYDNLKASHVLGFEGKTNITDGINEQIRHTALLMKLG